MAGATGSKVMKLNTAMQYLTESSRFAGKSLLKITAKPRASVHLGNAITMPVCSQCCGVSALPVLHRAFHYDSTLAGAVLRRQV